MATVSLKKNQVVNLSKSPSITSGGLNEVVVGLGWDPAKGGLFGLRESNIDCDAFCVALDSNNKMLTTVYYANTSVFRGTIKHTGDNLTGDGDGDDEQIIFRLNELPSEVRRIVIAVNIYHGKTRGQHFGKIDNAFIRIVDTKNNDELCIYKLSGSEYAGKLTMTFGELYRDDSGDWQFKAIGEGSNAASINEYARNLH